MMNAATKRNLDRLLKGPKKFKNTLTLTMADGTKFFSDGEDVYNLVGTNLSDENGKPLKKGYYETADGQRLSVDQYGKCTKQQPIDFMAKMLRR